MTSNSASSAGGALVAQDGAIVTATACSITSNAAFMGGAILTLDDSIFTSTNCTMTCNSAFGGGAIAAFEESMVSTTNCNMSSNYAGRLRLYGYGGALYAGDNSTIAATDCAMTSNSAELSGGAVYASTEGHRHHTKLYDDLKRCSTWRSSLFQRYRHLHRIRLYF